MALHHLEAAAETSKDFKRPGCDNPADSDHDENEVYQGEQDEDAEIDEES